MAPFRNASAGEGVLVSNPVMAKPESATGVDLNLTSHAPIIRSPKDLARLSLGALGVVYGDIGTSPLYAIKECFALPHGVAAEIARALL